METIHSILDLKLIVQAILIHFRGPLSQEAFSKKLGFNYNQYYKWEQGLKVVTWSDFVKMCKTNEIPIQNMIQSNYEIVFMSDEYQGQEVLSFFLRSYFDSGLKEMSTYLNISPQRLDRYLQGKHKISLTIILKILAFRPQIFLNFLNALGILENLHHLNLEFEVLKNKMHIDTICPYASSVQHFINSDYYQNQSSGSLSIEEMAKELHLSISQVKQAIQLSLDEGILGIAGQSYFLQEKALEMKAVDRRDKIKQVMYWHYRALCFYEGQKHLPNPPDNSLSLSGYRVFSASPGLIEDINQKLKECYLHILRMIDEDRRPTESVRVLLFNHFGVAESPSFHFQTDEQGVRSLNSSFDDRRP